MRSRHKSMRVSRLHRPRQVVVFDFDHTLFDTTRFKRDLFASLRQFGIPFGAVEQSYRRLMIRRGRFQFDYRLDAHLQLLRQTRIFNHQKARSRMTAVLGHAREYVFDGVPGMLANLRRRGYRLILITRGNRWFNRRKVKGSGIAGFFQKIHILPTDKKRLLSHYAKSAPFVINDNADELREMTRSFPQIRPVLKLRRDIKQVYHRGEFLTYTSSKTLFQLLD